MSKPEIKNFTLEELEQEIKSFGEPPYRAGQIFDWIYRKSAVSFDEFTDLPKKLRSRLEENYSFSPLRLSEHVAASDGTEKFLFKLGDGNFIETVLIPAGNRKTLCLSTQVGCKFFCAFCASGLGGFRRNLTAGEITGQVLFLQDKLKVSLTNFVFMGMGEPLDNLRNVFKAIRIMNSPRGLGIAARRVTLSTSGIVPGIEGLAKLGLQVNLSLSLHAVRDDLRSRLMPLNKKYPLPKVLSAVEEYIRSTGRKVTLEYVLIDDVNDRADDAQGLIRIAKRLKAKVNLIPYSPIPGLEFSSPSKEKTERFIGWLEDRRTSVTLRRSKGAEIRAACGQLAGKFLDARPTD